MTEGKKDRLNKTVAAMKADRSTWEAEWYNLEDYVLPGVCEWNTDDAKRPSKVPDKIIDDTVIDCIEVLQAGLASYVTNPARKWVEPTLQDKDLARDMRIREWLLHVQDQMLEGFRASNLYSALPAAYGIEAVYGTTAILFEEDAEDAFRFYVLPVGSYWCSSNSRGVVDVVYRELSMSLRQVVDRFGVEALSDELKFSWDNGEHDRDVSVAHMVYPNENYKAGSPFSRNYKYASCYWELGSHSEDDQFLSESGYRTFPVLVGRWSNRTRSPWGVGIGRRLLPLSRTLQSYERKVGQAIAKEVDPPLQAPTSMAGQELSTVPGAVNYVDELSGRGGIRSLYERGVFQMQTVMAKMDAIRYQMKRASFYDLFLLMTQESRSNVTAEEIRARLDEKILAIGPVLERLVDDILDPLFARALDILMTRGVIRPAPEDIQGMPMAVEYSGALAQGQKLLGLAPIDRYMGAVERIGQRDASAFDVVDSEAILREYADLLSVPVRVMRSSEEIAAIRQRRAQAQAAQQNAELLAQGAQSAKVLSETDSSAGALSDLIKMQTGI